jgi:hypothetical protein
MYEPASSMRAVKATEGYDIYRRPASFDGKSLLARNPANGKKQHSHLQRSAHRIV